MDAFHHEADKFASQVCAVHERKEPCLDCQEPFAEAASVGEEEGEDSPFRRVWPAKTLPSPDDVADEYDDGDDLEFPDLDDLFDRYAMTTDERVKLMRATIALYKVSSRSNNKRRRY